MSRIKLLLLPVLLLALNNELSYSQPGTILIKKTPEFTISGNGIASQWANTEWIELPQRVSGGQNYSTRVKLLYSPTGLYFLYNCADKKLSATMQADFLDLWNEDVIEVFLQPDTSHAAYLEYELSPLNFELPLIIYNVGGKLNSWIPFHYEGERKTRHATTIQGGERKTNATVEGWMAEFFIPYALMKPVLEKVPVSGSTWKGNLYRIDYDKGEAEWSWKLNSGNFHEFEKFGTIHFE